MFGSRSLDLRETLVVFVTGLRCFAEYCKNDTFWRGLWNLKFVSKEAIPWQVNEFQAGIWYCPANGGNRQTNADFVTSPSKGPECLQIVANLYCIFFKKVASSKRKVLSYWLFCYNCGIKGHPSTACLKAKQKHHRFKQSEIHWGKNTRYYAFTRWTRWITCTLKESRRCTSIILRWGKINESLLPQQ